MHATVRRNVTERVEALVFCRTIDLLTQAIPGLFIAKRLIAEANVVDNVVDIAHMTLTVDLCQVVVGRVAENWHRHATKGRMAHFALAKRIGDVCARFRVIDADLLFAAVLFRAHVVVFAVHVLAARAALGNLLVNRTEVRIARIHCARVVVVEWHWFKHALAFDAHDCVAFIGRNANDGFKNASNLWVA